MKALHIQLSFDPADWIGHCRHTYDTSLGGGDGGGAAAGATLPLILLFSEI